MYGKIIRKFGISVSTFYDFTTYIPWRRLVVGFQRKGRFCRLVVTLFAVNTPKARFFSGRAHIVNSLLPTGYVYG